MGKMIPLIDLIHLTDLIHPLRSIHIYMIMNYIYILMMNVFSLF